MQMTKINLTLVLLFFLNFAQANELPYGLWQFPGNGVWVEILENGSAFQCRIAQDKSVITARGKLVDKNTINWGNITIIGANDNVIEVPPGIAWGSDKIILSDGKLSLSGPYGTFIYEKCCSAIPKICRK
jgi:hypothetical protein